MSIEDIRRIKMMASIPKPKKVHIINKVSEKRKKQLMEWKNNTDDSLDKWFAGRRLEMTGFCANCGGKSCKDDDVYYKFSIAHLLPKAYFESVAKHRLNWLELCFFGNSCHSMMDNKILDLTEMNCFNEIIEKFIAIYPSIAKDEKRRIPSVLMNYIDIP